jgi:hypothetical protein
MTSKGEELLKLLEFVWSFVVPANPNPTTKLKIIIIIILKRIN